MLLIAVEEEEEEEDEKMEEKKNMEMKKKIKINTFYLRKRVGYTAVKSQVREWHDALNQARPI